MAYLVYFMKLILHQQATIMYSYNVQYFNTANYVFPHIQISYH